MSEFRTSKNYWNITPLSVKIWCGVSRDGIIGSLFFGITIVKLTKTLWGNISLVWTEKKGFAHFSMIRRLECYISRETIEFLTFFFDSRVISFGLWPPKSPGLYSPNLFFMWYLEESRRYMPSIWEQWLQS